MDITVVVTVGLFGVTAVIIVILVIGKKCAKSMKRHYRRNRIHIG